MLSRPPPGLFTRLSRAIGRESASNELRWMRQTLQSPPSGIPPSASSLEDMVNRRIAGEPLQYILGSQPFGPLHLIVRPPVLIPRPETEEWAIRLAEQLRPLASRPLRILDLCTGTGCIPLLLCHTLPPGSVHATGVDISDDAVQLARENAQLCRVQPAPEDPSWRNLVEVKENTFTAVSADIMHPSFSKKVPSEPPYDVITANPPYIPMAQYARLPRSVRKYEDMRALTPLLNNSSDGSLPAASRAVDWHKGLSFYHRIAHLVAKSTLLSSKGTLAVEVGEGQAGDVVDILRETARLPNIEVWKDLWGKERAVVASR